jgi:hypothetical protein
MQSCLPAEVMMQVVSPPAARAVATTFLPKLTSTGAAVLFVWPIWPPVKPWLPAPQQATAPADERAQAWERPAATWTAPPKPGGSWKFWGVLEVAGRPAAAGRFLFVGEG